jgi:Mg2+-importing ATPase
VYDFLTFYVLLHFFHFGETLFHTGWFVESLATQTLILFVIRTADRPWKSPPSLPLTITCWVVVAIGLYLPFSPLANAFGFSPVPASYFLFLTIAVMSYLAIVEVVKRRLVGRLMLASSG